MKAIAYMMQQKALICVSVMLLKLKEIIFTSHKHFYLVIKMVCGKNILALNMILGQVRESY